MQKIYFYKIHLYLLALDSCGDEIAFEYAGDFGAFQLGKYCKKTFLLTESSIVRYLKEVKKRMKIEKPMPIEKTKLRRN